MAQRRIALKTIAASLLACACAGTAFAQPFPSRPVTLIVPFGPGGTSDIMARALQQPLAAALNGSVVIDNKAGAGGAIGMQQLQRAKPDGYTVGLSVIGPEVLQPALRKTGYTHADFDHICGTYAVPLMMMVPADSQFKSAKDVVEFAKANPGKLAYGSSGNGTILHLSMAMLMDKVGGEGLHVPFKSTGEMVTGLLGKQVMLFNETPTIAKRYNLRPLAVFADKRLEAYPQVPTMAEAGFEVMPASVWGGVIAPKGLPADVAKTLEQACQKATHTQEYRAQADKFETPLVYRSGAEFAKFVQGQAEAYGKLANSLGLAQKE
ncbi:tripartite tricarboxylate transporter substrate binding protein [Ramlibacter sp. AN1015]|uniref:tripartite tricarboxylate transporter substrate binding protein n=1 Tax=Ramlibacter sp. AN1015 TaxID=3133428 RepID=UPI0030C5DD6E